MKFKLKMYLGNSPFDKKIVKDFRRVTMRALLTKKTALVPNYTANDFGAFDEAASSPKVLKKIKKKKQYLQKQPKLHIRSLIGALCAVVAVTLSSGMLVIFSLFSGYGKKYTPVSIPSFISQSEAEAIVKYPDIFFYDIVYEANPDFPEDAVTSQTPPSGTERKLYRGERITLRLTVNRLPDSFSLPQLVGNEARELILSLKNAGLKLYVIEEYSDSVPSGKIISTSLPEGTEVRRDELLKIYVSLGKKKQQFEMPKLVGLGETAAVEMIRSLGLRVEKISYSTSTQKVGTVILQSLSQGSVVTEGDTVSLTVSSGLYYE